VIDQQRRFLTVRQLVERWACSRQTVERLLRADPSFPTIYRIGTNKRTVRLDQVEAYERRSVAARVGAAR
jgi:hypothetical protein